MEVLQGEPNHSTPIVAEALPGSLSYNHYHFYCKAQWFEFVCFFLT